MKKLVSLLMAGVFALSLVGCGVKAAKPDTEKDHTKDNQTKEKVELVIFAAASMTETLEQIAKKYKDTAPNVTLTFNFDSSGTLKTQIEEGAECDIFISAAQKQMDQLDIEGSKEVNTAGLDFVDSTTRINLLENRVALVVPEGNPKEIKTFEDMASKLKEKGILLSMGNSDVPVGQYTQKIFKFYGLNEEELAAGGAITYGTNVKEVTTQVKEGSVDAGVVYCTDAYSAGLTAQDYATAEMCGQVIYPAAVMKNSKAKEEATTFLKYLQEEESMKIFEQVGFIAAK
ncbi:MAG: molybdate ABC transporter substrate-binding protein [Clostridium sp.]